MADTKLVSAPYLIINNKQIAYEPNSLVIKRGIGDRQTHALATGGGNSVVRWSEDVTTKKGMVKFGIRLTAEYIDLLKGWQNNENSNAINSFDGSTSLRLSNAVVITDPELNFGADTTTEVSFEGSRVI